MQTICLIAFVLSIVAGPCMACSPPIFWAPQGIIRRMQQAPVVFRGKVTSIHNAPESWYGLYEATFNVDCVYKTGGGAVSKTVRVADFGYDGGKCVSTRVSVGESYIVLADTYSRGDLSAVAINMQNAAPKATPSLINRVEGDFPCNQAN